MDRLRVAYHDFDGFFAACEKLYHPELLHRPVAIAALDNTAGSCVAACYIAKAHGVRTGTSVREARHLCPGITILPSRHRLYVRLNLEIAAMFDSIAELERIRSVDEHQFRLSGPARTLDGARRQVMHMKQLLKVRYGSAITFSAGVAANPLLAKISSKLDKPDGFSWLGESNMPQRLAGLDLTDLPGISSAIRDRLSRAGVTSIPQLWSMDPRHARAVWRSVDGERFVRALRGEYIPLVATRKSGLGAGKVLSPANRREDAARQVGRWLVQKASARLRRQGWASGQFSLHVALGWHDPQKPTWTWERSIRMQCSQDSIFFLRIFEHLWSRMCSEARPVVQILSLHVQFGGLVSLQQRTGDLLEGTRPGELSAGERVSKAMDLLNDRFGPGTVVIGEERPHPGFFERG